MTADPKPDAVTADKLRELAALARPCDCDDDCSHDWAYSQFAAIGGWKTIAMGLLDEADELRAELAETLKKLANQRSVAETYYKNANEQFQRANELERALAEARALFKPAHAVVFAAAIEAAIATAIEAAYPEDGVYEPSEKHIEEVERATVMVAVEAIRALTPPDITAAAARVLLAAWPTDTSFDAAFAACATAYHGGDQMQDTMDRTLATVSAALRALAEVKP